MKKLMVIFFIIVYSAFSAGVTVLIHTCGGESEALFVVTETADPCVCGDEMSTDGRAAVHQTDMCCTIDLKTAKIDDAQKVSVSSFEMKSMDIFELHCSTVVSAGDQPLVFTLANNTSPPPLKDFQISNSVFLI